MAKVYVEKERVDHIFVKNTTGAALEGGDFVVLGGYSGVVDRNASSGEMVSLHIEGNIEIQVGAEDLEAEANGYAENIPLYYSATTRKFADAADSDYVKVGQIAQNHLSGTAGYITFFKYPLIDADAALQSAIDAETEAREAADAALQSAIDGLS